MKVIITEDQFKRVIVEYGTPLNTDEFLLNKGLEYEYPKQWEHDSPTTYRQAWYRGREFYEKATSHMEKTNYSEKYIYVYEFYEGDTPVAAYIGLTCNIDIRRQQHEKGDCSYRDKERLTTVTKFMRENPNLTYKVVDPFNSQYFSNVEAAMKEEEVLQNYKKGGWNILNIFPTGGLGKKFVNSNETLRNIASTYKTKKEWREKDPHTYKQAFDRGREFWIEVTKDMPDYLERGLTKDQVRDIASRYETKKDWERGDSPSYNKALKFKKEDLNWYEGITDHMVSGYKRRYEKG